MQTVFEEHYSRTATEPTSFEYAMSRDEESSYQWDREGEQAVYAIMNAANIPEQAAQDIQTILEDRFSDYDAVMSGEETEFSSDSHYEEKRIDDSSWWKEWSQFERSLKTEARFFNQIGARHLAAIFDGLTSMKTRGGRPMIAEAGPGMPMDTLYRGRSFQSDEKLRIALTRPDRDIGSPPQAAAAAGRMNPYGISVFYGATDAKTALAEVRPPVGSQVAVARFEIIRQIRLLDLTALADVKMDGSIFDPTFARRLGRAAFLKGLSNRMTTPVMPDDEALEYITTQAIADFLSTDPTIDIDGIIYPSIQAGGGSHNVVLFHKAALVEPLEVPAGARTEASFGHTTEDGWEIDYSVSEILEITSKVPKIGRTSPSARLPSGYDNRTPTVRIDRNNIYVHIVRSVEFYTADYLVTYSRIDLSTVPF